MKHYNPDLKNETKIDVELSPQTSPNQEAGFLSFKILDGTGTDINQVEIVETDYIWFDEAPGFATESFQILQFLTLYNENAGSGSNVFGSQIQDARTGYPTTDTSNITYQQSFADGWYHDNDNPGYDGTTPAASISSANGHQPFSMFFGTNGVDFFGRDINPADFGDGNGVVPRAAIRIDRAGDTFYAPIVGVWQQTVTSGATTSYAGVVVLGQPILAAAWNPQVDINTGYPVSYGLNSDGSRGVISAFNYATNQSWAGINGFINQTVSFLDYFTSIAGGPSISTIAMGSKSEDNKVMEIVTGSSVTFNDEVYAEAGISTTNMDSHLVNVGVGLSVGIPGFNTFEVVTGESFATGSDVGVTPTLGSSQLVLTIDRSILDVFVGSTATLFGIFNPLGTTRSITFYGLSRDSYVLLRATFDSSQFSASGDILTLTLSTANTTIFSSPGLISAQDAISKPDSDFSATSTTDFDDIPSGLAWYFGFADEDAGAINTNMPVTINDNLTVTGDLILEGTLCSPYDIQDSLATASTLTPCNVVYADATSSSLTYSLPSGSVGDWVKVVCRNTSSSNTITISPQPGEFLEGVEDETVVVQTSLRTNIELTYINSTVGWAIISN